MATPENLICKEWSGKETFPEGELDKYVIEGLEDISEDLKEHSGWNGSKPVATIALGTGEEGQITSTSLFLVGHTQDKLVEGRHLWSNCKDECHVKVKSFDMSTIYFRGSLSSDYVSTSNFPWVFRVPSKSKPGYYHEIDKKDMAKYGADTKLWLRLLAQPWLSGNIKISAGLAPIDDIRSLSNHMDPRCPLVEIFSLTIPLYPRPNHDLPIPCVPYILDQRTDKSGDMVLPTSDVVFSTVTAIFKNQIKPNLKKSLWEKARGEDWNIGEPSRYTTSDRPITADEESDQENLGEIVEYLCTINTEYRIIGLFSTMSEAET